MVHTESSSSSGKGGSHYVKKDKFRARSGGGKIDRDKRDSGCHPSSGTPRRKGRCKKCGVYGHWAKECLNKKSVKEDHEDAAHHVSGDMDKNPALLVAQVHWEDTVPCPTTAAEASENAVPDAVEPGSPAASIPSSGGASNSLPHTPSSIPGAPMVQWATPPTGQSVDSDGAPLRYRTIPNLLETTEEL
ncbi:unnamed protein product [Miscanthus lutarioriparius]|uniref:CCHC-type domain-containing protein n=1 Tax=Miscanthus lutarioriparius TaxID=422564 RepID=A0A811PSH1_9POAL|nr:unnamed protein product [Miscanthus lutarioriparius]